MFIQGAGTAERTYDAIVVGSGISGGWAAKELTEKGLRTLVLERGRDVKHPDYPTAMMESWQFAGRNRLSRADLAKQEKQNRTGYTTHPASAHWFVNDVENPYSEVKRFDWMRGYHVGGRSLLWGRQSYRFSELDFEANARDGVAVDWPIRYADIAPWYDYVERFAGISGSREGLPQLPDGQFLPPMEMNCLERQVKDRIAKPFGGRPMIIGRVANLTQPHNGRGGCQYRNRCIRGCPYGAYFSSNAATLPAAYATGKADAPAVLDRDRADLRRQHQAGHRRAHRRCGDEPDDGVLRARHLSLCVGGRVDVHPAQLDLGSLPERPRQRQRRAGPQPDGPPLQGGRERPVRRFRRPVLSRGSVRTASTSRGSAISTRSPGRRTTSAASATRAARAARTGRAASRS